MGHYTLLTYKAADDIIENDLKVVVDMLTSAFGNCIRSIFLTGGFGRGEGAVIEKNGAIFPLNDYDIVIVPKLNCKKKIVKGIKEISNDLDLKVNVKQVDLAVISAFKLFIPFNSVARYEIKNGHQLLWGKNTIINSFGSKRIPLIEGTKYYATRMGGLLIAYLLLKGKGGFDNSTRSELIDLEINKAILTLGDSLLIKHGLYNCSYKKRKVLIQRLIDNGQNNQKNIDLYINAINERFTTKRKEKSINELKREWLEIVDTFLTSFLEYESDFHRSVFRNTEDYVEYFKTDKSSFMIKLKGLINDQYKNIAISKRCEFLIILSAIINNDNYSGIKLQKECEGTDMITVITKSLLSWHPSGIINALF